jgi:mxaK protein
MLPRWRQALPWLLLALALAGLMREAWLWQARSAVNQRLLAGLPLPLDAMKPAASAPSSPASWASTASDPASAASAPPPASWLHDGEPLAIRFGQALALGTAGADDAALARYRSLYDDPALGLAARYNAANVLLRRGMALQEAGQAGSALPLIELAKEGYRQVLRQRPGHLPARYNLERAQRLLPEQDPDEAPTGTPEHAERAATTMRSVSQGLP